MSPNGTLPALFANWGQYFSLYDVSGQGLASVPIKRAKIDQFLPKKFVFRGKHFFFFILMMKMTQPVRYELASPIWVKIIVFLHVNTLQCVLFKIR